MFFHFFGFLPLLISFPNSSFAFSEWVGAAHDPAGLRGLRPNKSQCNITLYGL
nr:hypothetical protein [uncultured bacterium]